MTDFDPEAFREFEHEGRNRLYEGYHSEWEHLTTQTIDNMLVKAGVSDGRRVFDLACGPGYCAIRASEKGAEAIGIDLSENMIELAKKLAPNADFKVGDAEELPFGDGEFDVVLINFGMLHFPNPEKVLAEVFRVLKPNGKLAFTA